MNPATWFEHKSLDLSHSQIRLLKFKGTDQDGRLSFTLSTYRVDGLLKRCPTYRAVSYTWGSETQRHEILLNGALFDVRPNLYHFLEQLAADPALRTKYYWVDQICIDQSNVDERNHVVAHMSMIYSKAQKVMVWLGPQYDDSDYALSILSGKAQTLPNDYNPWLWGEPDRVRDAMLSFMKRDYWTRVWIVQELMLARNVEFHCGGSRVQLFEIQQNCNDPMLSMALVTAKMPYEVAGPHAPTWTLVGNASHPRRLLSWRNALEQFGNQRCSDARDRVFALQGLIVPESRIVIDYHLERVGVLIDATIPAVRECFEVPVIVAKRPTVKETTESAQIVGIRLADALLGDVYPLSVLLVMQSQVWDTWLSLYMRDAWGVQEWKAKVAKSFRDFRRFLEEARSLAHRRLASSIQAHFVASVFQMRKGVVRDILPTRFDETQNQNMWGNAMWEKAMWEMLDNPIAHGNPSDKDRVKAIHTCIMNSVKAAVSELGYRLGEHQLVRPGEQGYFVMMTSLLDEVAFERRTAGFARGWAEFIGHDRSLALEKLAQKHRSDYKLNTSDFIEVFRRELDTASTPWLPSVVSAVQAHLDK